MMPAMERTTSAFTSPLVHDHDAAPVLYDPVGSGGHVLLIGAYYNDVVGVMGHAGGNGAGLETVALEVADADVAGVLVALDDGDLQNIPFHVDVVAVALVLGDDLAGHHADDAPGSAARQSPGR